MIWALVAASAVFWGLKLVATGARAPAHAAVVAPDAATAGADLTRVFGAAPVAPPPAASAALPPADARFKLVGVAAGRSGRSLPGLALIAVDGKPARAFAIGSAVDAAANVHVLTVAHRRVELGPRDGPPQMTLELPGLAEAARGTLPAPGAAAAAMASPPPRPAPAAAPPQPAGPMAVMPTTPDIPPAVPPEMPGVPTVGRGNPNAMGMSNTR